MLIFLKLAWANRGLVAIGVGGLLVASLYVLWQWNGHLSAQLAQARADNAVYAKNIAAMNKAHARELWRVRNVEKIKGEIANAEDGPVADSLRLAIERVRELEAAKGAK